jgi:hypothetical protein
LTSVTKKKVISYTQICLYYKNDALESKEVSGSERERIRESEKKGNTVKKYGIKNASLNDRPANKSYTF